MNMVIWKNFDIHRDDYIQSIKTLRSVFDYGLKETKDICDRMRYEHISYKIDCKLSQNQIQQLRDCNFTVEEEIFGTIPENLFSFGDNSLQTKEITFTKNRGDFYGVLKIVTPEIFFTIKLNQDERNELIRQLERIDG